ncbi:MAG: hypothetical protein ABJB97_06295 [Acidobacteriota bacterium]
MKLILRLLAAMLIALAIVAAWMWWNRPGRSDMADFAPADAIVYLESNSLVDIAEGVVKADAWKALSPYIANTGDQLPSPWLRRFTAWTGIGPTSGVILARAQVAVVMLDLGAREQGDTITIKPQAALLIETHTSRSRINSTVEQYLELFADKAYGQPTFARNNVGGTELLVWSAPGSDRRIVAAVDGSLVIVGNSESAVTVCLEVHRGQRPSLRQNNELQQIRAQLASDKALAFGFVSSAHAAQLISLGAPLLFGRSPGGLNFDRLISSSAPKVVGAAGWSAQPLAGGIEDRYLFSLQPTLIARLQPFFGTTNEKGLVSISPEELQSLTIYKFAEPLATWQAVQTALSSQLDALSAVIFTSLLKSALMPYGIENPEEFLRSVGPEVMTVRLKPSSQGATLIAQVRDESALRGLLSKTNLSNAGKNLIQEDRSAPSDTSDGAGGTTSTNFVNGYVVIGPERDVQRLSQMLFRPNTVPSDQLNQLYHFVPFTSSANVVTYANDAERIRNFILAIGRAQRQAGATTESSELDRAVESLPFAGTETVLTDRGLDRRTKSAFGQFSTLLPLLFPEHRSPNK